MPTQGINILRLFMCVRDIMGIVGWGNLKEDGENIQLGNIYNSQTIAGVYKQGEIALMRSIFETSEVDVEAKVLIEINVITSITWIWSKSAN